MRDRRDRAITTDGSAGTVSCQWLVQPGQQPPQPLSQSVIAGQHAVYVTVAVQGSGHGSAAQTVTLQVRGPDTGTASAAVTGQVLMDICYRGAAACFSPAPARRRARPHEPG